MKPSLMFRTAKRGTPGRRAVKWLNDAAVARAKIKSQDINHQMKFMSRTKRLASGK